MFRIFIFAVFAALLILSGCGKSKAQLDADARELEKVRVAVKQKMDADEERLQAKLRTIAKESNDAVSSAAEASRHRSEADRAKDDAAMIKKFQERVIDRLKDPSSAQFRDVRLNDRRDALCGTVNAKNGFGGYTGFSGFVATSDAVYLQTGKKDGLEDLLYLGTARERGCI